MPQIDCSSTMPCVGIVGLGAVGKELAGKLYESRLATLGGVAAGDGEKARRWLEASFELPPDVFGLEALAQRCDVVVECAVAAAVPEIARHVLAAGKKLIVLSAAGLLGSPELIDLARSHRAQLIVPTGALLGLDAVTAAAEGDIRSVKLITRKPPRGLIGAPHLTRNGIELDGLVEPLRVFEGSAREAAIGFPANVNVAAALSLAGIGPDRTQVEVWADPSLSRNTHRIAVESDSSNFTMSIENIPSENPKTGRITALSILSLLRKMYGPLRVGS